jgi:hypothetical protein
MESKEEIEQLAESYLQKNKYNFDNWKEIEHVKKTYIDTYSQYQEDMKSLLLEIKDNWKGDKLLGGTYEKICNLLNKQD